MKVLAIGCHPDDVEIACSGTLIKCVKRGDEVYVCHVSTGNLGHVIIPPDELTKIRAEEAKKAGADVVGAEDLMEEILKGSINFERCIATPDMMGVVGRLRKVLGPRGLMPNPKLGTVTMDVAGAVKAVKAGQVEFRVEAAGQIHAGVGKISFDEAKIKENVLAFAQAVLKAKPASIKGTYLKAVALSTTQGVGVKVSVPNIAALASGK